MILFVKFINKLRSLSFLRKRDFSKKYLLDETALRRISKLESKFGIAIKMPHYYIKALTHRSYSDHQSNYFKKSNERLEFLGDSVLGMVVAKYLFKKYPGATEGYLTKTRSQLVNKEALVIAAERLNLKEIVLFNEKFVNGSSEGLNTIIADALEALLGAIYLDQGLKTAEKIINKWILKPRFSETDVIVDKNYKGQLLEYTHSKKLMEPVYKVVDLSGPEHHKMFTIEVFIGDDKLGSGIGHSKKAAEQEASKNALEQLKAGK